MEEQKSFSRKHFFINRQLQGKYMISFLVPMVVMLGFMLFTLYFASQSMIATTTRIIREDIDNNIAIQLQDKVNPPAGLYANIIEDIKDYLRTFSTNEKYRRALLSSLLWIFGIGLFLVILQIVILTIFISHKLAGPIFRFEKICHQLIEGDYTENVHLRKGDEMQNLAGLLNRVIERSRSRLLQLKEESDPAKREEICADLKI